MKVLPLGQLLALPIQSTIRAQNLAIQETISLMEQFGVEDKTARTFRIRADRTIEQRIIDPQTGTPKTIFVTEPVEFSIPLLALASPSAMNLQEMNIEFGVHIVEPKTEPIKSAVIPSAPLGLSLASSLSVYSPLQQTDLTTMKVSMRLAREVPGAMGRSTDLLADLLAAHALGPSIDAIPNITEVEAALKAKGILRAHDLVATTSTAESIKELATSLGVSEERVREWRATAEGLLTA